MITGPVLVASNARIKDARKLDRRSRRDESGRFLVEGHNGVQTALARGIALEVFATEDATARWPELYADAQAGGIAWHLAEPRAVESLSDAVSAQGIVAVAALIDCPLHEVVTATARCLVICVDARDPGNVGTVIRTADAVGADGVVLAGSSVDLHNPKTVRSTAGSLFNVPVAVATDIRAVIAAARAAGLTLLATAGGGELDLFEADAVLQGRVAWLMGNEAHGLDAEIAAVADHRITIPMRGGAESLNLAVASAICLYATTRVHAAASPS